MTGKKSLWFLFSAIFSLIIYFSLGKNVGFLSIGIILIIPCLCLIALFPNWVLALSIIAFWVITKCVIDFVTLPIQSIVLEFINSLVNLTVLLFFSYFRIETYKKTTELEQLTLVDPLTKSFNRRYLEIYFTRALPVYNRITSSLSIIAIDIDYFKNLNDKYGHVFGDQVLTTLVNLIKNNLREMDSIVRLGGEEFIIILPHTDIQDAEIIAEMLRYIIENASFMNGKTPVKITISAGVTLLKKSESYQDILERVDLRLYEAKNLGRNRVQVG